MAQIELFHLAHSRTGDKGDSQTMSLIPYRAEDYSLIERQVSAEVVRRHFGKLVRGNVARYDPASKAWQSWHLPGARPQAYAVFVDDKDIVWLSDWGANAIVRFDPASEAFTAFPSPRPNARPRDSKSRQTRCAVPNQCASRKAASTGTTAPPTSSNAPAAVTPTSVA